MLPLKKVDFSTFFSKAFYGAQFPRIIGSCLAAYDGLEKKTVGDLILGKTDPANMDVLEVLVKMCFFCFSAKSFSIWRIQFGKL